MTVERRFQVRRRVDGRDRTVVFDEESVAVATARALEHVGFRPVVEVVDVAVVEPVAGWEVNR